jgi:DNA-directed RNA polymerase specialized sigma subunit
MLTKRARDKLIEAHAADARRVARVYCHRAGLEAEEAESMAVLVLCRVAGRYDPAHAAGAKFWTYAEHRIVGHFLDARRMMAKRARLSEGRTDFDPVVIDPERELLGRESLRLRMMGLHLGGITEKMLVRMARGGC